jgi:hypothetical protein
MQTQVKQQYDIDFGFRKSNEQREELKKAKNEALRGVRDKYDERVKWIEEACVDRIATAQSNLNRLTEEKRQAKERAYRTQVRRVSGRKAAYSGPMHVARVRVRKDQCRDSGGGVGEESARGKGNGRPFCANLA